MRSTNRSKLRQAPRSRLQRVASRTDGFHNRDKGRNSSKNNSKHMKIFSKIKDIQKQIVIYQSQNEMLASDNMMIDHNLKSVN